MSNVIRVRPKLYFLLLLRLFTSCEFCGLHSMSVEQLGTNILDELALKHWYVFAKVHGVV
jgi:hypothetical protein